MFKNYLKIAFRNIIRHKAYSFINITGLALGMASCILISLFVRYELSYDRYHENAKNIYRVERNVIFEDFRGQVPITSNPYGPTLKSDFPEIKETVRIIPRPADILDKNNQYNHAQFIFADANVFDIFTWPLIKGNKRTALTDPYTIVISESLAERYFPATDPLSQTITLQLGEDLDFKVTAVVKDIPENSHFTFDAIISHSTLKSLIGEETLQIWFNNYLYTYLLLQDNVNPAALEAKFPEWQEKYMGNRARELFAAKGNINDYIRMVLKPLTDIHLYSNLEHEIQPNGDIATVYIFSAIAFLTLLIACINFMNLSTARSMDRAKEVGLRKVVGAKRSRLISQFFGESILLAFIALILAVTLIETFIPIITSLAGKQLFIDYLSDPISIWGLFAITLFVGIFAGSYPAFFLSSFQPAAILKGKILTGTKGLSLRKGLVIIQFSISISLIIATLIILNQLQFLRNKKLGFNKEHVAVIPLKDGDLTLSHIEALQNEIAENVSIVNVATCDHIPGNPRFGDTMFLIDQNETVPDGKVALRHFGVGYNFTTTLGIEFAAGRNFSPGFTTDSTGGYIVNEAVVRKIGWSSPEEAVGKRFAKLIDINPPRYREGKIVGVVKDFHFRSLHRRIEPVVMELNPNSFRYLLVRIQPQNIPTALAFLEEKMNKFSPGYPFEYFFQDEYFDKLYKSETRLMEIVGYFTFLAIFIAALGLFGLASFTAEQRTREIGIRKVLGASVGNVVMLLTREFTKWVLVANVIAWPIAWLVMNSWLQNFAYRIEFSWWVFVLAGGLALLIALATISTQAIRVALANPVESLRYE
jgi:putative ABC transport system permease protein